MRGPFLADFSGIVPKRPSRPARAVENPPFFEKTAGPLSFRPPPCYNDIDTF